MYKMKIPGHNAANCKIRVYTAPDFSLRYMVFQSYATDVALVKITPKNEVVAMFTGNYSVTTSKQLSWFLDYLRKNLNAPYLINSKQADDLYRKNNAINLTTGEVYDLPGVLSEAAVYIHRYNSDFTTSDIIHFITLI